jgi:hypothetical protein
MDEADVMGMCEIAILSNTKLAQSKRGCETSEIYKDSQTMTAETSWLYMTKHHVICESVAMMLVAIVSNLNPTIERRVPRHFPEDNCMISNKTCYRYCTIKVVCITFHLD